jgi:putative zinc finger protein
MAQCSEIELLLGPFTDGELEPHEMEEVALHVVACRNCKTALDDYRALGVTLRGAIALPELAGFSTTVQERIQQFRVPLHIRIKRPFDWLGERMGTAFAMGAAAAVAAVVTAVVVTPYAGRISNALRQASGNVLVANRDTSSPAPFSAEYHQSAWEPAASSQPGNSTSTAPFLPNDSAITNEGDGASQSNVGGVPQAEEPVAADSQAIISRLEANSPSVAVWSEPQTDTTVIWVPDQP